MSEMSEERELTREELLEAKLAQLEEFLEKIFSGPRSIGVVEAGPFNKFYRVIVAGQPSLLPYAVEEDPYAEHTPFEVGAPVIISNNVIESLLPDELFGKEEPIDFTHITWDEIGGMKSQIQKIREAVENPLKYGDIYKKFNRKPLKGILLYGEPGCGKTLIAKAIASFILGNISKIESESFMYFKGGEMLYQYVGAAEQNIKNIFDKARKHYAKTGQRSIVFIDEAEAIMPSRGSRVSSDVDKTIVPTFLGEMDGFEDNNPFIILATNLPEAIDSAIQRPGRIDLKVHVGRPDKDDSADIFKIHLGKTTVLENKENLARTATELLWKTVPSIEKRISGAYIANIVESGIDRAIKRNIVDPKGVAAVTFDDLKEVIVSLNK